MASAYSIGISFTHAKAATSSQSGSVVVSFLDGIALAAQAIPPIPTHFSVTWSVVLSSVVCLSHSCPLLKPFDGFRCYLAGTLCSPMTPCVRWGVSDSLTPEGNGRFGGPTTTSNCKLQLNHHFYAATWQIQTSSWVNMPQRFRFLPNYFGSCTKWCWTIVTHTKL